MNRKQKRMIKDLQRLADGIRDICCLESPKYNEVAALLIRKLPISELRKYVSFPNQLGTRRNLTPLDLAALKRNLQAVRKFLDDGMVPTAYTVTCAVRGSINVLSTIDDITKEHNIIYDDANVKIIKLTR